MILPIQISDIPHQSIRSLEDATTFIATLLSTKKHLATYMARRKLERQKRAGLREMAERIQALCEEKEKVIERLKKSQAEILDGDSYNADDHDQSR